MLMKNKVKPTSLFNFDFLHKVRESLKFQERHHSKKRNKYIRYSMNHRQNITSTDLLYKVETNIWTGSVETVTGVGLV